MTQSYARMFNGIAAEAYKAFPEKMERLVIFSMTKPDAPVFISPAIADQLTMDTAAIKEAIAERKERMHALDATGLARRNYTIGELDAQVIALDPLRPVNLSAGAYPKKMQLTWTLDHEIGHIILRNGFLGVSDHMAESAANAYAALRHLQRFGADTGYIEYRLNNMALALILYAETEKYSSDVLERAMALPPEYIRSLSLEETAKLAEDIADQCATSELALAAMCKAYQPVKKLYDDPEYINIRDMCNATFSVMRRNPHNARIIKAGKRFLNNERFANRAAEINPQWKKEFDATQRKMQPFAGLS